MQWDFPQRTRFVDAFFKRIELQFRNIVFADAVLMAPTERNKAINAPSLPINVLFILAEDVASHVNYPFFRVSFTCVRRTGESALGMSPVPKRTLNQYISACRTSGPSWVLAIDVRINVSSSGEMYCLRCRRTPLDRLETGDAEIAFFVCPACHRHYALKPGKGLTYRWGHPISLALYSVIFDEDPAREEKVSSTAADLIKDRSNEEIAEMVSEINLELLEPVQKVRDILDCHANEEQLRAFLKLVSDRLERSLQSGKT